MSNYQGFTTTIQGNPLPIVQPPAEVSVDGWSDDTITYVTVTQDRLDNNKRNLPIVLPHVDKCVIVDGFSKDGTYEYLTSLGPKVEVFQREWDDSFANQYNEYLRHVKGGWVLLCDDDEVPSEELLSSLREIVAQSERGTKFGVCEFRANDISYIEGEWDKRVDNGPCEYYRQIFFKWNPNLKYTVNLHQALQGMTGPVVKSQAHYYHVKSTRDQVRNACRNYFIGGEWPSGGGQTDGIKTPEWHELKELLSQHHPEVSIFSHMNGLMVSGELNPALLEWAEKYRDHNTGVEDESSGELRCYSQYLDILKTKWTS